MFPVKNTPLIVALAAVLGLLALTVAAVVRSSAALGAWQMGTMAAVWTVLLGGALVARTRIAKTERDGAEPAEPQPVARDEQPGARPPYQMTDSSALLALARELHGTLESDRLRLLIAKRLPALVGRRDVWVIARFGTRQQIIVPSASAEDTRLALLSDEPRQWMTYPMKAEGRSIGVLGIGVPAGGFSERDHWLLESVASLVAQSLSTANAFETMRETSVVDPLTGCMMRAEGARRVVAELRRADRSRASLAVIMLDLDHFKSINDRYGHETGDAVLSAVGQTLLTTLRASDVRCRWGGEEFLLVLPDSSIERARRASDKLRQRIANTPVRTRAGLVRVTASIGITLTQPGETDLQPLLTRADAALYEAKNLGRNRIRFVLPGPSSSPRRASHPREPLPRTPSAPPPQGAEAADTPGQKWRGPERRNGERKDRRRVPSPGRRATDRVLAGPWRED